MNRDHPAVAVSAAAEGGSHPGRPDRRGGLGPAGRLAAHAALVLVGLLIVVYPFTVGARVDVSCYGRPLQPGQSCSKADGSPGQSYEERVGNARAARPVIVVVGLLVTGFGAGLLVTDLRRRRPTAR